MATELNNYENDYRLRYRTGSAGNISGVGINVEYADYNVVPLPNEATYGLYGDSNVQTEAADSAAWPLELAETSFSGLVEFPDNDGRGPIADRIDV